MRNLTLCACLLLVSLTAIAGQSRTPVQRPNCESPSTRSEELVCRKGPLTESELNEIELPGGRRPLLLLYPESNRLGLAYLWDNRNQAVQYQNNTIEVHFDDTTMLYSDYLATGPWIAPIPQPLAGPVRGVVVKSGAAPTDNAGLIRFIRTNMGALTAAVAELASIQPVVTKSVEGCTQLFKHSQRLQARTLFNSVDSCIASPSTVFGMPVVSNIPVAVPHLTRIAVSALNSDVAGRTLLIRLMYKATPSFKVRGADGISRAMPDAILAVTAYVTLLPDGTFKIKELAVPLLTLGEGV